MGCFLGIELPDEIKNELVALQDELKALNLFKGTYCTPDTLHITLLFLGHLSVSKEAHLVKRIAELSYPSFSISLGKIELPHPADPRVLWVTIPSHELETLFNALIQLLPEYAPHHPFTGHITLARIKKVSEPGKLINALTTLRLKPRSWSVSTCHLTRSDTTPTGPVYTVLHSLPLTSD